MRLSMLASYPLAKYVVLILTRSRDVIRGFLNACILRQ